jgi:hypothetical protein
MRIASRLFLDLPRVEGVNDPAQCGLSKSTLSYSPAAACGSRFASGGGKKDQLVG